MPLLNSASAIYLGTQEVDAIFVGNNLAWPPAQGNQPVITNVSTLRTLTVSWPAVENASSYTLKRNGSTIASPTATTYNDSGLSWNTTYTYTVTPIVFGIPGTESPASAPVYISTPVGNKPTITNVSTLRTLTVSWAAVTNASSYKIYRNSTLLTTVTGTTYNDSGLVWGSSYSYTISPIVGGLEGTQSAATSSGAIPTPVGTTPTVSSVSAAGSLVLSWGAVANATSYNIYRNGSYLANTASLTYTDTGLAWGSTYTYTTAPIVGGQTGTQSASTSSGVIPSSTIYTLGSSAKSYTGITVNWSAAAGATSYNVYVNGTLRASTSTLSVAITTTENTTISVYVRAYRNGIAGGSSPTYYYYSGRAEQRDIGSKTDMIFEPVKLDSWREADDWAWLSGIAAQGYYTSSYGSYKGVIYYGSSGVRDALRSALGTNGTNRQLYGTCVDAEVYLYKKTGVGTSAAVSTDIRHSTSDASGAEPSGSDPVTRTTAASGSGSWIDIPDGHGQAIGDGTSKSLMVRKDGSSNYAQFTDGRLRLSWSWNYVTVTAAANTWTT